MLFTIAPNSSVYWGSLIGTALATFFATSYANIPVPGSAKLNSMQCTESDRSGSQVQSNEKNYSYLFDGYQLFMNEKSVALGFIIPRELQEEFKTSPLRRVEVNIDNLSSAHKVLLWVDFGNGRIRAVSPSSVAGTRFDFLIHENIDDGGQNIDGSSVYTIRVDITYEGNTLPVGALISSEQIKIDLDY
ncbi:hypothetical protein [Leptolyngbya sp. CCY15150]|uniref:hypothetical protein n=1 Tax=Leptolyngbya sp. CCY15150 TaxID=2767772 RepID=UPI00194F24FC|nr:hypothetical protein [Leptolyngbya sp. CCY15150]